jgi:hypothetical protein
LSFFDCGYRRTLLLCCGDGANADGETGCNKQWKKKTIMFRHGTQPPVFMFLLNSVFNKKEYMTIPNFAHDRINQKPAQTGHAQFLSFLT